MQKTNRTTLIITEMTECIVREVDPLKIILFGSAARGQLHDASDVDLLVIEDAPFGAREAASVKQAALTVYLQVLA